MSEQMLVNKIPSLTWNWLKMNKDSFDTDFSYDSILGKLNKINSVYKIEENAGVLTSLPSIITSESEELESFLSSVNAFQTISIEGQSEEPLVLYFNLEDKKNTKALQYIHAKAASKGTVILVYESDVKAEAINTVKTVVYGEENSEVSIVKVQLLSNSIVQIDNTSFVAGENAKLNFTQIELGGKHIASGLYTNLAEYKSQFKSNVAYFCGENQILDMNHVVYHIGKKTESDMQVNGSLRANAVKTYRGTIDFKNSCSGAKGNEFEETLLLSPTVVNKSIPVILCDEEDVEGEHGSTIGRLSKEVLFFMESRGISEQEAEKIMAKAKVQAVIDTICDEDVKSKIQEKLERIFVDEK